MMSDSARADQMGQATREKLRQFVARIELLDQFRRVRADKIHANPWKIAVKTAQNLRAMRINDVAGDAERDRSFEFWRDHPIHSIIVQ